MDELALHPTVKPVAMIADAIKDVSSRGGIVLDLFGGSGSTLIAAHKTGPARASLRTRSGLLRPDHPPLGGLRQGRCRTDRLRHRTQALPARSQRQPDNGPSPDAEAQKALAEAPIHRLRGRLRQAACRAPASSPASPAIPRAGRKGAREQGPVPASMRSA